MQEIWRRKWQPTPVFLPRKSHGQRSLMGYSPCLKESDMTEHTHTHTHFSPLYVFLLYFPLCDNLHKPFINLEKSPSVNYISYKYFSKLIIVGVLFCFFSLVKLLLQSFCSAIFKLFHLWLYCFCVLLTVFS